MIEQQQQQQQQQPANKAVANFLQVKDMNAQCKNFDCEVIVLQPGRDYIIIIETCLTNISRQ